MIGAFLQLPEPVLDFLFLTIAVPIGLQVVKAVAKHFQQLPPDWVFGALALGLGVGYTLLSGSVYGFPFPAFPAWAGDVVAFLGGLVGWVMSFGIWLTAVWGPIEAAYRKFWRVIFDTGAAAKVGLRVA